MDLTDQQWALVQPIISERHPPSSSISTVGGRPPIDPRPILDGVLWKIRNAVPWADLPKCYPSHHQVNIRIHDLAPGTQSTLKAVGEDQIDEWINCDVAGLDHRMFVKSGCHGQTDIEGPGVSVGMCWVGCGADGAGVSEAGGVSRKF